MVLFASLWFARQCANGSAVLCVGADFESVTVISTFASCARVWVGISGRPSRSEGEEGLLKRPEVLTRQARSTFALEATWRRAPFVARTHSLARTMPIEVDSPLRKEGNAWLSDCYFPEPADVTANLMPQPLSIAEMKVPTLTALL
jgi:hypothetical protein